MDSLQWFILAILGVASLNHMHVRYVRFRIIRELQDEGKSADEIAKVLKAYKED